MPSESIEAVVKGGVVHVLAFFLKRHRYAESKLPTAFTHCLPPASSPTRLLHARQIACERMHAEHVLSIN